MEKFITATGKTIDLAIEAALRELKMDRDSVSVEVLENPRSGFLGIGAAPAKVKVTYEVPDEEVRPAPALSSASRSKPKKAESRMDVKPLNPINPPKPKAEPKAETARPAEKARPVEKPQEKREKRQPKVQKTYEPARPRLQGGADRDLYQGPAGAYGLRRRAPRLSGRERHLPGGPGGRRSGLPDRPPGRDPGRHSAT